MKERGFMGRAGREGVFMGRKAAEAREGKSADRAAEIPDANGAGQVRAALDRRGAQGETGDMVRVHGGILTRSGVRCLDGHQANFARNRLGWPKQEARPLRIAPP